MKNVTDIGSNRNLRQWWLVVSILLPALFFSTCPADVLDRLPQLTKTELVVPTSSGVNQALSFQGALQKLTFSAFLQSSIPQHYFSLFQQSLSTLRLKSTEKENLSGFIPPQCPFLTLRYPASDDDYPPLLLG